MGSGITGSPTGIGKNPFYSGWTRYDLYSPEYTGWTGNPYVRPEWFVDDEEVFVEPDFSRPECNELVM